MNEKFFDLKKEKQDRIINASFEIFADNGYSHASTDEIVKKAEISKGLLFHYFISKMGLYTFLYDYAARYVSLEIKSSTTGGKRDYFALRKIIAFADMQIMGNYPYMLLFIERAAGENDSDATEAIQASRISFEQNMGDLIDGADHSVFKDTKTYESAGKMLDYSISGLMHKHAGDGTLVPETVFNESNDMIELMRRFVTGE